MVKRARWVAETLLLPDASGVDASREIPLSHFRALSREGLFGLASPELGLEFHSVVSVIENLASGCLATTFVWMQHHLAVIGLSNSSNESLRSRFLADLIAGKQLSGNASAGVLSTPPRLVAARADGGWIFSGEVPFVSGWGIIDQLLIFGSTNDIIVSALVDVNRLFEAKNVGVLRQDLIALHATMTVALRFDNLFVPDTCIVAEAPADQLRRIAHLGSRLAGALPIGLAVRCADTLERYGRAATGDAIRDQIVDARTMLDEAMADPQSMAGARAAASALAYRAAGAVVVAEGGSALRSRGYGQRFVREALFTLVTGTVPPIKDKSLELLSTN